MCKHKILISSIIAITLFLSSVFTAYADTTYRTKTGTIDGYSYNLSIWGNTVTIKGSTGYAASNCARACTITGTYVSTSFSGSKTKTIGNGGSTGTATAVCSVYNSSTDRFTSASTVHNVNGWSYSMSCSVY